MKFITLNALCSDCDGFSTVHVNADLIEIIQELDEGTMVGLGGGSLEVVESAAEVLALIKRNTAATVAQLRSN